MSISVFDYEAYKKFMIDLIDSKPNAGRGVRRLLGEAIGCQVAYVSHVLAGDKNFSPEQLEAAARFFALRDDETDHLMLLGEFARAGTPSLRKMLAKKISQKQSEYREIKKRIKISKSISQADQATYYSSWHYQAITSILTIPECRTVDAISRRLKIPTEKVNSVLSFLLDKGLVKETSKGYEPTETQIHLPRTSPLIGKLHSNWRVRTLASFDDMRPADYHYSGVVTLAEKDYDTVKEILTKALSQAADVIRPSKEETICVLAMDFFEL